MEKIRNVFNQNAPNFNTVTTTTSVQDALYKMHCEHVDFLIVEENNKFIGLLTEHDIVGKMLFADKPLEETLVQEFMNTELPVVTSGDSLEYAMQLLEYHNARYLAVYEGFDFKAVISAQDLMRRALKLRKEAFTDMAEQQQHHWDH